MSNLPEFLVFALVGAAAQLVDGALGMAYGVTSAGLLLGLGMPPVMASASVHYAETFTCGASGLSHLLAGNVRRRLFLVLAIPGALSALLGVWLAVHLPASWLRIALTPYLLGMGLFLLLRSAKRAGERSEPPRGTVVLGANGTDYTSWTATSLTFSGTALSFDLTATAAGVALDNISAVPEPSSLALLLGGATLLLARRRA